ncbi:MAG: hypothetical protein J6W54_05670 [Fibrobacter sp.]|uniref:hypothetical protein n=1 Tax=Fibrobacter sp. TaxID=35828 RepID=UPI001B1BE806|nr:hypothetical protein [Fibrobacter sp.]MBO7060571.1 hypothetical protein [Fibrobacter sp.]
MSDSKKKVNAKTLQTQFSAILTGIQKMRSQAAAAVNEKASQFGLVRWRACKP